MSDKKRSDAVLVGVDDGYAAIKLSWFNNKGDIISQTIPSQVREGEFGVSDFEGSPSGFVTDGISYTVGDFKDGERTRFADFALSRLVRVLVHYALIEAGFAGKTVAIASGLPPRDYFLPGGREKNDAFIKTKIEQMGRPVTRIGGGEVAVFSHHVVYSQAIGAVIDEIYDVANDAILPLSGPIGVVDVGGRTTDIAVIVHNNRSLGIDHSRSGSEDIGVLDTLGDIELSIRQHFRISNIPLGSLRKALETGTAKIWGKDEDVSAFVEAAKKKTAERIRRAVSGKFGDGSDLDRILFVGGGAHSFGRILGYPNVTIPKDPEYSNSRGFLKSLNISYKR